MGRKIEKVSKTVDMAKVNDERAIEKGAEAVSEAQEAKSILEGIKAMDVEEEVQDATDTSIEAVKGDAGEYMSGDVHESIDEAEKQVGEVSDESNEQIDLNDQAIENYESIDNYGREQAGKSIETAQEISITFEDYTESAEYDLEETEEEHEQQLEEIMG